MDLEYFHPAIRTWFTRRFSSPSIPQAQGWPVIVGGEDVLIAAPTGSGKTLTAFLAAIDRLLKRGEAGELEDRIHVVYVSPLRALSNDMKRNLEEPLQEIAAVAAELGNPPISIRVGLRTGDTSPAERAALLKRPPHILVTTPESLYLLLTSDRGRQRLSHVETVIVDEIHALVRDKRGSHWSLTLERLQALVPHRIHRIGLSATQRPMDRIAAFLVGICSVPETNAATGPETDASVGPFAAGGPDSDAAAGPFAATDSLFEHAARPCRIIDVGHQRDLDLGIETPASPLGAVCTHEQWGEVNSRLCELIQSHRSTLIFVNTRRMAERVTHQLTELLGPDAVSSHHGSLAAPLRQDTEKRLKNGELKAVVATASLELGLDIGYIDLVVQLGSPRSIAVFLQRVGRSGHALGLTPRGRLFALTRDELFECAALFRAITAGRLDIIPIPESPLDILAQQIVAETSARDWNVDELFDLCRRSYPFRNLSRRDYDAVLQFLSEGIGGTSGKSRVYLHHDHVRKQLRARPGARISAATSGGAIPELASYRVVVDPENTVVGSVDEEFGVESQAGDVFLLGNTSWRILGLRGGDLVVADAHGAPPTIPFWRGEAPGRTLELSEEVSRLRDELSPLLDDVDAASQWLVKEAGLSQSAADQLAEYAAAQRAAIGLLPSHKQVVFERFFDESGGMQLVIHAPFGSRITRAWGLAMRKRFCRSFDFELQATADDDGVVLSLGPQHSFPLESMFSLLNDRNVQPLLEQALLAVPTFQTRWRWNVTRALLVLRQKHGKKVPPPIQRFKADDLLTAVFPQATGCLENHQGDVELPDHPLVRQTMHDSLTEALDIENLKRILGEIERGEITLHARDTREPSPFSYELLNANPYAFLDGGEVQERRARMVGTRRSLTPESVHDLGRLDPQAIVRVRGDAQPLVRNADELHDILMSRFWLAESEGLAWSAEFTTLVQDRRATRMIRTQAAAGEQSAAAPPEQSETNRVGPTVGWVAAERLPAILAAFPDAEMAPPISTPETVRHDWSPEESRVAMLRGLIDVSGPITAAQAAERLSITESQAFAGFEALEGEGLVLRGRFTPMENALRQAETIEWCHRRLLARIHRLTTDGLRKQIEPVPVSVYWRFLSRWHGFVPVEQGGLPDGIAGVEHVVRMLQGLDLPAVSWERDLLRTRLQRYRGEWLDQLCLAGAVAWGRLYPPPRTPVSGRGRGGLTRIVPVSLFFRGDTPWLLADSPAPSEEGLGSLAVQATECLRRNGATFAADLANDMRLLPLQLTDVLGELVSRGIATADGFEGLRALVAAKDSTTTGGETAAAKRMRRSRAPLSGSGRWSYWRRNPSESAQADPASRLKTVEAWAWQLLRRWGVVFRDLLDREHGVPRWFELLGVYRRMEARGQIRGGRFISGVAGEQFAAGDVVSQLRRLRDAGPTGEMVVISAVDPLNLVGLLTPDERVPSKAGNRIAYVDGVPVAALIASEFRMLVKPTMDLVRRLNDGSALRRCGFVPGSSQSAATDPGAKDKPNGSPPTDRHVAAAEEKLKRFRKRRQQALFPPKETPRPANR